MHYVYILSNPSLPEMFKVGMTTRTVKERVAELDGATSIPTGFVIEATFNVAPIEGLCMSVEKRAHKLLSNYRVNKGREFFRGCTIPEIKAAIDRAMKDTGAKAKTDEEIAAEQAAHARQAQADRNRFAAEREQARRRLYEQGERNRFYPEFSDEYKAAIEKGPKLPHLTKPTKKGLMFYSGVLVGKTIRAFKGAI
jgi:hypothetical protein